MIDIQEVIKNGKIYFRINDNKKLYPTKEKAERQIRAINSRDRNKK